MSKKDKKPKEYEFYKWINNIVGRTVLQGSCSESDVVLMAKVLKYYYIQLGLIDDEGESYGMNVRNKWKDIIRRESKDEI